MVCQSCIKTVIRNYYKFTKPVLTMEVLQSTTMVRFLTYDYCTGKERDGRRSFLIPCKLTNQRQLGTKYDSD